MRCVIVLFSIFHMFLTADAARADQRVALVIGNGAYNNVHQLPNPPISAKAMADLLRKAGFDVIEATDLKRKEMTDRLVEFGKHPLREALDTEAQHPEAGLAHRSKSLDRHRVDAIRADEL